MTNLILATDEDLAIRAIGDMPAIYPRGQKLAEGSDGVFAGSGAWTLASASNDFAAQGLAAGVLVFVYRAGDPGFDIPADTFAVDSVLAGSATLRRPGMATGQGFPPQAATGVRFRSYTAAQQVARTTYEVQRKFNIQTADDVQDFDDLRRAVVLGTLELLYFQASRNIAEQSDDFGAKYKAIRAESRAALDDLAARYGLAGNRDFAAAAVMAPSADAPLIAGWPFLR